MAGEATAIFLITIRIIGVALIIPVLGQSMLGGKLIRNTIALGIGLSIFPVALSTSVHLDIQQGTFDVILLSAKEFFVGVVVGFFLSIPFWAMDVAGYIIDTVRGSSISSVFNPLMGGQSSIFGMLLSQLMIVTFVTMNGFGHIVLILQQSYIDIPVGTDLKWFSGFNVFLFERWELLYDLGLRVVIPPLILMVVTDMSLGLINRSVKQLQVFSLSMPIKSVFAILLIIMALPFVISYFERYFNENIFNFTLTKIFTKLNE